MSEMLRIGGLRKHLGGGRMLAVESFSVRAGKCALVFGANGCGKTTFLKILAGLLAPEKRGEWRLDERDCVPARGGRISGAVLLHQTPYMFAASARDNVALAAKEGARADSALAWAGLSRFAETPARELSGGEQARISLARARAATNIKLCLMDEPAAHLDAEGLALAGELIDDLRGRGAAVVVSAPSRTEVIPYDCAWRLCGGKLSEEPPPQT